MNLKVEDYYPSGKRFLLRFKEKGGKEKELPVHHKMEGLLDQYLKATGMEKEPQSPLFPASIGKTGKLSRRPLVRTDAADMLKRRLKQAGLPAHYSPHSFPGSAISWQPIPSAAAYLKSVLYVARKIWRNQYSSNGKDPAMATLYISYKAEDRSCAKQVSDALEELGHRPIYDAVALAPGKDWRHVLADELSKADACVVLLNERSLASPFVLGEIGAARALYHEFGRMLLVPVILGDLEIPPVINDLFVVRMASDGSDHQRIAKEIGKAVTDHFNRLRMSYPRIFISHRHKDVPVVEALVSVVEAAFEIQTPDLRCTSVHPYRLRAGERTSDRLRLELQRAEAVLGIVTPDTKESTYVLFELGASWGRGGVTFPLLAFGASAADVPAPIGDLHTLDLSEEAECHQLIEDLSDVTTLNPRDGNRSKIAEQISKLATISRNARAK